MQGLEQTIRNAIRQSILRDQTTSVAVSGCDSGDVIEAIEQVYHEEWDHVFLDREGVDAIDAWSQNGTWRLYVTHN